MARWTSFCITFPQRPRWLGCRMGPWGGQSAAICRACAGCVVPYGAWMCHPRMRWMMKSMQRRPQPPPAQQTASASCLYLIMTSRPERAGPHVLGGCCLGHCAPELLSACCLVGLFWRVGCKSVCACLGVLAHARLPFALLPVVTQTAQSEFVRSSWTCYCESTTTKRSSSLLHLAASIPKAAWLHAVARGFNSTSRGLTHPSPRVPSAQLCSPLWTAALMWTRRCPC